MSGKDKVTVTLYQEVTVRPHFVASDFIYVDREGNVRIVERGTVIPLPVPSGPLKLETSR